MELYPNLIVARPFRKAARVSKNMIEEDEVGRGIGGPIKFAAMLAGAQLIDELMRQGLRVDRNSEHYTTIDEPDGSIKVGVEITSFGLFPDERLPKPWWRK